MIMANPPTSAMPRTTRNGARIGVHSSVVPHGLKVSETGDASLTPMVFSAYARQTYSVPLVRPSISAVGSEVDAPFRVTGQVAPPSVEHSYRKPEMSPDAWGATPTRTASLSA